MENQLYTTRDLTLASVLMTLQFYLDGVDYELEGEGKRPVGYFNFERTEKLIEAEKMYWAGKISVEPRTFMTNIKDLKSKVNGFYKSPRSDFSSLKESK